MHTYTHTCVGLYMHAPMHTEPLRLRFEYYFRTPAVVSLVVGEHDRSAASSVRQTLDVASIFVHELYDSRTYVNDIAVIKTATAIALNVNVQPICAPDETNTYHYSLSQCSGWGTLSSGNHSGPGA